MKTEAEAWLIWPYIKKHHQPHPKPEEAGMTVSPMASRPTQPHDT